MNCDYCHKPAELVDSEEIYGRSYNQNMWRCKPCQAWVGCHKGTDKPLGRLANAELRKWKMKVHDVFDPIWKGRAGKARKTAYQWLANELGIKYRDCHIGMFNIERCQKAVKICLGIETK